MTISEEIEQLKKQLASTSDTHTEAELLLQLLMKYASFSSTDGQPFINRLIQLAEETGSAEYKAWGLLYQTFINRLLGKYDVALNQAEEALSLFGQVKNTEAQGKVYNSIGSIHFNQGNYPDALKNYTISLQLRLAAGVQRDIAVSYNNLGIVHE